MKKILIVAALLLPIITFAQEFDFGKLTNIDKAYDRKTIDSAANAVVLNEYGRTMFDFNSETGKMKLVHNYHVRIKIFTKEGFDAANIIVPLYKGSNNDDQTEFISNLKASTFNYEQGGYFETKMDAKAVFNEQKSRYLTLTKFTLPQIKEESIIEYSYTIETPFIFNYRTWNFQEEYPKVNSTYIAFIPANYKYNATLRGFRKLSDNKAELSTECLRVGGQAMDCSKLTYNMKDIPAFVEEEYMTAPSNFKSAIYFELEEIHYLNGSSQKYTKSWKDVDYELTSNKDFGGQMKRKDVFKDIVPNLIAGATTDLDKAKAIYTYIKKQIKWNNYNGKYSETSVKEVIDRRSGNVADINFALISALSAANLDVEAVILSTRENGTANKLHPILSNFNYVIAKVNIGDKSYLLDGSDPLLPFGLLPLRCINDQGRVIHLKKPSYWIDLKAATKSATTHSFSGKLLEDGRIVGALTSYRSGFDALNLRNAIKKFTSIEEYVEKKSERMTNIKIKDFKISDVDSVEKAITEQYQLEFIVRKDENIAGYFNPFFINPIRKNPFKLNERSYPVDLGAANEERILVTLELPENYVLKEIPKDISIALPNQGGRYILQTKLEDGQLTVNQNLAFNRAIYTSEEYHYLKEFYNQIIQSQKSDVLLVKQK
jgi:hypothetical protein